MVDTTKVEFGYGSITYFHEIEAVPPSSQREGNVTINNMGSPGSPAFFEVSTMITARHEVGTVEFSNIFHWKTALVGLRKDTPYAEVDAQAARQFAPMLRAVADQIEQSVLEYDARQAELKAS